MPRLRRIFTTGKAFFVTTNIQKGLRPFNSRERKMLCQALNVNRRNREFRLAGYVIMPDHAHFLIVPRPEDPISTIVQQWKRKSAIHVNSLRRRKGQLWQKGYFERYMRTAREFLETLEYIHFNPARKGLVDAPEDWQWSSASAYSGSPGLVPVEFLDLPA